MPYRRKYYRRKKPGRLQIYGRAGKQLYKDVMYLKTLVNAELHTYTRSLSNNIDSTGETTYLDSVPQGDGDGNRTGNSILPRYQTIYMHINKAIAGPDHETFRVILFRYWGESTSVPAVPTVSEVLSNADPLSFLNDDNTGSKGDRERRIEVHKSKIFTLDNVAKTSMTWKWNLTINGPKKKVKDHIKYGSSSTAVPISGGFFLLFISDNATGANKSSYNFNAKLGFYDN